MYSCKLCFETANTVGMIENHIENDHNVSGHISEYWEGVHGEDEPSDDQTFFKQYS